MSNFQISGGNFVQLIGDTAVHVVSLTASISDEGQAGTTAGLPDGYTMGMKKCEGELEIALKDFSALTAKARAAGSWEAIPPEDIHMIGAVPGRTFPVSMYGCKFKISDLPTSDNKGGEASTIKLPFEVTDERFVKIDGVPYAHALDSYQ